MNDDIVTRLRREWEYGNNAQGCDYEMFSEAADEIELLRAELERLSNCMKSIYDTAFYGVHGE